ncbi:hypothetical protein HDU87_004409 [Geranomyces variabilis]|uniref:Galactose oxidase n=1 Tax=Geranomyces variabilis TaxID=109894 RepID=A0AAD5XQS2_9FUNG|nr:hypothetical protein HDU87_004409 [Geranomyces variabilis]
MKAVSLLPACAALFGAAIAAPVRLNADGVWSNVLPLPLSPISGAVTPTGELLMWSGNSPGGWLYNDADKQNGDRTYYSVFSLDTFLGQQPIQLQTTNTVEMFCPGTSNLPDGTILVNGGSSVLVQTDSWLSFGMSFNANLKFPYAGPNGEEKVFHAGPVKNLHDISVTKNMYSPGRVFKAGGATAYGELNSGVGMATRAQAYTITFKDLPTGGRVVVKASGNMNRARAFGHAVVLPGGKILLVGGKTNLHLFEDTNGVLEPEIYDPTTGTFTLLAPMNVARNYHSLALLTKYGNVFVAGGGAYPNSCSVAGQAPCTANVHFNGQVFTPPYLSQGQVRPAIVTVSGTTNAQYGGAKVLHINDILTVKANGCGGGGGAGCTYELLRIASETHSVNNDQLRVPLQINTRGGAANGDTMAIFAADKAFVMAGYYYLFAIAPNGTPSVAATVQVIR